MQQRYIEQEAVQKALCLAEKGLQSIYEGFVNGEESKPICVSADRLTAVYEALLAYAHTYEGYHLCACQCEEDVQECGCCH